MKKLITAIGFAVSVGSFAMLPAASYAQIGIGISVAIAPPPIPIYVQPPIPAPDYLWTPGYWAWNGDDYYFVPGSWIEAPQPGYLWTPGYWGWRDGGYFFNQGYWGPHIGFYGGIDYGFGYGGVGYRGGYWRDGHFSYNQSVNNINRNIIHNTYNERIEAPSGPRVGYNGGQGGVRAEPSAAERQAQAFPHTPPTAAQTHQVEVARADRNQFASVNHGAPPVAATARPGEFTGAGVTRATAAGGPVSREAARPGAPANAGAAHPPQSAVENANRATARTAAPRAEGLAPSTNPAARSATPAARPATPAARPATPAARPATPVERQAARPAPAAVARPAAHPAAVAPAREAVAPRPPQPAARPEAAPRPNPGGGGKEEHH
jgi:hypothetical protein